MPGNGNECGKTKVMKISKQLSPIQIMTDQKQPNTVEYFNCLGSIKCTREIKSRIVTAKAASKKKKALFTSKLVSKFKEKTRKVIQLEYSFVWC
jgi:hypothetical protein